ncbi:MAG: hypothetical protein NT020_13800 [Chloroflexales bacterium]|nr:hypothetical protein [Chloroflexales bacterium]
MLICPGCAKSWPQGTAFCPHCTTSLHNAKLYGGKSDLPISEPQVAFPVAVAQPRASRVAPIADSALERISANGYWVLRLRATRMTLIGYLQLFGGVVMVFGGLVAVIVALTSQSATATITKDFFSGIIGFAGYIAALVGFVFGYRMLLGSFTTFGQRDELLMRIDVAMNTALIAAHIANYTQASAIAPVANETP